MSAIQFLREKAGVLVSVLIGFSLFIFVISDYIGNGRSQRTKEKEFYEIGRIDGEYVSYQEFDEKAKSLFEIYQLSGSQNIDEQTAESLREQVWQQMVREKIQDKNYNRLGIGVSDEEVDELVLGDNPHPIVMQLFADRNTGMYDRNLLVNFLNQVETDETARKYWLFFENQIITDRMNSKFNSLIAKGLYVTSKQAEFDKTINKATVDFSFVQKSYSAIGDSSVTITDNDVETYYASHKDNYKRFSLRDIEYITFDVVPSENDIREAEKWMNNLKNDFIASADPGQFVNLNADTRHDGFYLTLNEVPENLREFVKREDKATVFGPYNEENVFKMVRLVNASDRPDSVHARHILIGAGQTRTLEQTISIADSLVALIKSGAKFEEVAMNNSDDQGSAQLGGDLGWFPEGRMVVPFNNACFTAGKGQIVTTQTSFGTHIIEILGQSGKSRKYDVAILDRKVVPSTETNQLAYVAAQQFASGAGTYESFNKQIADQKLNKRIANDVAPAQKTLPGIEFPRGLIISLFGAKEGEIILDNSGQAVFEMNDKYVVAYCTRVQEEGVAPLKDVESDVRFALLRDKKAEVISAEFRSKNTGGKSLDDLAREMILDVKDASQVNFSSYTIPGLGVEPALIAAASAGSVGVLSGPVKGNNGVYMLTVNNVSAAPEEDLKMLQKRLSATYQMRGSYEAFEALRKKAEIVDKRYKFY